MTVERRKGKSGMQECLCSACGKWSTFGLVSMSDEYTCPECLQRRQRERQSKRHALGLEWWQDLPEDSP